MANPLFTPEQLAYLGSRYAKIPHNHTWEQVIDTDGETLVQRVITIDESLDALEEAIGAEDEDDAAIDLDEAD